MADAFGIARQGIHDGADQHLDEAAAHRVDGDGDGQPQIWIGQYHGQNAQCDKSDNGECMGRHGCRAVTDAIHRMQGHPVCQNLHTEIDEYKPSQHLIGYVVTVLEK